MPVRWMPHQRPYVANPALQQREWYFDQFERYARAHKGAVVSIRGSSVIRIEIPRTERNTLADLAVWGGNAKHVDTRKRIEPAVTTESMTLTSSGQLELAVEGSTKPVTTRVTHAGEIVVDAYEVSV